MMKLNIQMFASTNKTANYELPQFIGSDKPTWLGDFNTAMATIDGGMAENKSDIESMNSRVSSAESTASQASQNVSALTTRVGTVETSVSSATTTANNAQQTATSALNTANTANGKADTNASAITTINSSITTIHDNLDHLKDYSSNEAVIGTWIDGKPLYRTIFNYGQLPNNTGVGKAHNIPIDTPVSVKGTVKTRSGDYSSWTIPSRNIFVDLSRNEVYISTDRDRSNVDGLVIIEYTKTTD